MAKSPMAPARMVGRAVGPLRLGGMTMSGLVTSRMWHPASSKTAAVSAGHTLSRWERGLARGCVLCVLRSEEHTSELQSRLHLVCRLLLEKKKYQRDKGLTVVYSLATT